MPKNKVFGQAEGGTNQLETVNQITEKLLKQWTFQTFNGV